MPQLSLPDGDLWYAVQPPAAESLPPVLLVHGAGGSHLDWPAGLRRLPGAVTYTPDLPGHGRSAGPAHDSIDAYARVLLALLDALAVTQCVVIGHSMGGAIAQQMALLAPERVVGLVLIATGARLPVHPDFVGQVLTQPQDIYERVARWLWPDPAPEALINQRIDLMAANSAASLYADFTACDRFDVRPQLAAITAPTLVIGGTADRMTPLKFSQLLAERIPQAEQFTVKGAGHMVHLEHEADVTARVSAWLARRFTTEELPHEDEPHGQSA